MAKFEKLLMNSLKNPFLVILKTIFVRHLEFLVLFWEKYSVIPENSKQIFYKRLDGIINLQFEFV